MPAVAASAQELTNRSYAARKAHPRWLDVCCMRARSPIRSGGRSRGLRRRLGDAPFSRHVVPQPAQAELDSTVAGVRPGLDRALCADGLLGAPRCMLSASGTSARTRALVAAIGAERGVDAGFLRRSP